MVQTTITLNNNLNRFVDVFKAQKGLKNKNETINEIIKEFQKLKKEELQEEILAHECCLASEKSLAKAWLSKEDEEAFAYLQSKKEKYI
jgi:metal-responsive CopG/Arc/MetJ family transcriptional regulator